jgi:hypothetical protein
MPVNVLYRTSARATGGRDDHSATLDGAVDVKLVPCGGRAARADGKLVVYTVWNAITGRWNCTKLPGLIRRREFRRSRSFSLTCILTTAKGSRKPLIK